MPEHMLFDDNGNEFFLPSTAETKYAEDDDLAVLLAAIESSQANVGKESLLPHLPAELLLYILENIPPSHILPLRLVCRAFRDCVDSHVFYSYIQRVRLVYPFIPDLRLESSLTHNILKSAPEMNATFLHLEDLGQQDGKTCRARAKWDRKYAVFQIDPAWLDMFVKLQKMPDEPFAINHFLGRQSELMRIDIERIRNDIRPDKDHCEQCGWLIELGETVNDTELPGCGIDIDNGTISFLWREMLWGLLKEEDAIRNKSRQVDLTQYTFKDKSDYLRLVRRQRLKSSLDPNSKDGRRLRWAINYLDPLFNRRRNDAVDPRLSAGFLEVIEQKIMDQIMPRRREAALTTRQKAELQQFIENRRILIKEQKQMRILFDRWLDETYSANALSKGFRKFPHLYSHSKQWQNSNANPLTWSDEVKAIEDRRMNQWLSSRDAVEQISSIFEVSSFVSDLQNEDLSDSDSD